MQREIGKTGVKVRAVGLGTLPLSVEGRPDEAAAIRIIQAALEAGTDFIDTADVYCLDDHEVGHNERLVCKALLESGIDRHVIVATKGGCTRPHGRWGYNGNPAHLRMAAEQSRHNLQVDSILLYQLHAPDPSMPLELSVEALAQLKAKGVLQHIGLCNVTPEQLTRAQKITRIESVQNRCNPFEQHWIRSGLVELCKAQQVTFISHSPVGGFGMHKDRVSHEVILGLAEKYQTSPYCILLSWHLSMGSHVLPIPGASRIASATDSPKAVHIQLTAEDRVQLDQLG
jgi:aryl-alcohol dehydrogenase-like predicted oxidoreductase